MRAPSAKSNVRPDALPQRRNPAVVAANDDDDFSSREALGEGFRGWLSQLPAFAGCAAAIHAPLLAFAFLPDLPWFIPVAIFAFASIAAAGAVHGALAKAVLDGERRLHADFTELLEAAGSNALSAIAMHVTIVVGALPRMLLLFPGLRWLADTFAAIPVLACEGGTTTTAFQRSARLARGARPRILMICAVPWTTATLVAAASGVFGGASFESIPWLVAFIFARALDTSLAATLAAITYSRLRDRPGA